MESENDLPHQPDTLQQQPPRSSKPLKLLALSTAVLLSALVAGVGGYWLGIRHMQSIHPSQQPSPSPQAILIPQPSATVILPSQSTYFHPSILPISLTSSADVPTATTQLTSWKTYRSEKYGFTIQYPPEWSAVKSDGQKLEIVFMQNIITVSVYDFRSSTGTFQAWVDERPYALTEFKGRRALRWYTSGDNITRTEVALIPAKDEDWAVSIDLAMNDKHAPSNSNYVRSFDQMIASLNF